jgi:peroxiredoxin
VTTRTRRLIGVRLLAPVVALAALLSGCTAESDHLAGVYESGTGGGYISGDGRVVQIAASDREQPVAFEGTLDTGDAFDSADVLGEVVIVNFWYASCPPCREEAPDLEALHQQFADAAVTVVGVNVSDTAGTAQKFEAEHGVSYPSIIDYEDNAVQLAFAGGKYAPNSVPTTLVLDKQGRVAARFSGLIESPSVVADIVDELLAEKA